MASDEKPSTEYFPKWGYLPVYLSPFLLFLPALMPGKALFWGITSLQFIPWHWEALRSLQAGELPLWNIWNGMGAPLAANYQSALFYPPTWLTLLAGWIGGIQGMAWSHGLLIVLHLVWAGSGMKKLAERMGLSPIPQVICGISYSLCGYFIGRGSFLTMVQAAAWIPWVILAASNFAMPLKGYTSPKSTPKSILWLTLAFSGQWLSGHAQLAWYTLIFTLAWLAVGAMVNGGWSKLGRIILPVAFSGLLALLVCSIQLIPTIEYFTQSQRSGAIDYQTALSYSYWPWRLLSLIFPDLFGNPGTGDFWGYANYWEDAAYFGLLPLFFALYFLFSGKRRVGLDENCKSQPLVWFNVVSICLLFLLALGWNTPVFPWLFHHIPTFGSFNGPTRLMILVVFCLVMMAGFGAEEWIKHPVTRRNHIFMSLVGIAAMLMAGTAAVFTMPTVKESFKSALIATGFLMAGYLVFALVKPDPENTRNFLKWRALFIVWLMIDLFWAGWRLNPAVDMSLYTAGQANPNPDRLYFSQNGERDLRFKRFFKFEDIRETDDWQNLIPSSLPNTNILTSTLMVNNFDPMVPDRFLGFTSELEKVSPSIRNRLLALANVGKAGEVVSEKPYSITWNPVDTYPRVRVVSCAELVIDDQAALDWMGKAAEADRLKDSIAIESGIPANGCQPDKNTSNVVVTPLAQGSTRQEYKITGNTADGYLFLADTWYPGWTAYVDGREESVNRADYVFMAINIPAGDHKVKIEYRPACFSIGALMTLVGIVICVILGIRRRLPEEVCIDTK
jgi:hypothetical protein